MKKYVALLLALCLALSLVACGGTPSTSSQDPASGSDVSGSDASGTPEAGGADLAADPNEYLVGKTIGVQLGTTGDIYATDIEGAEVKQFSKYADAIMSLNQGKVDAVVIDSEPAKAFLAQNEGLAIMEQPLSEDAYAICVKKGNTELTDKLNGAIAELKEDGTLDAILDKYINETEGAAGYTTPEGTTYPNGKLVMATNATYPPYEFLEGDTVVGIDAEFAKAICDKLGYELEIKDMEFDAIMPAVNSGKADFGAAGMTVTPDRLENVDFTDSFCTGVLVVMVKK